MAGRRRGSRDALPAGVILGNLVPQVATAVDTAGGETCAVPSKAASNGEDLFAALFALFSGDSVEGLPAESEPQTQSESEQDGDGTNFLTTPVAVIPQTLPPVAELTEAPAGEQTVEGPGASSALPAVPAPLESENPVRVEPAASEKLERSAAPPAESAARLAVQLSPLLSSLAPTKPAGDLAKPAPAAPEGQPEQQSSVLVLDGQAMAPANREARSFGPIAGVRVVAFRPEASCRPSAPLAFAAKLTDGTAAQTREQLVAALSAVGEARTRPQAEPEPAPAAPVRAERPAAEAAPQVESPGALLAAMAAPHTAKSETGRSAPAAAAAPPAPPESRTAAVALPSPPRPEPLEAPAAPLREVALVVPGRTGYGIQRDNIEVRLSDHRGQVHVAVRTRDADLTGALREQLGDLIQRLEQSGYRTEAWRPVESAAAAATEVHARASGDSTRDHAPGGFEGHGSGNGAGDGRQPRRDRGDQTPWIEWLRGAGHSSGEKES